MRVSSCSGMYVLCASTAQMYVRIYMLQKDVLSISICADNHTEYVCRVLLLLFPTYICTYVCSSASYTASCILGENYWGLPDMEGMRKRRCVGRKVGRKELRRKWTRQTYVPAT